MTLRVRTIALFIATALLWAPTIRAGDVNSKTGTTSFPFLKINVGARAVAMGSAFTALADDESALYYNPAGIALFEERRLIGAYQTYFADMQSGFLGYISPVGYRKSFGIYASYLNYGDFTETSADGTTTGEFGGSDLLIGLTGAYRPNYSLSFGATLKFIYEKLQDFSATGVATDLGVRYTTARDRLMIGFAVQHLGFQLSSLGDVKDPLPLSFRGGIAARPRGLPITLAGDLILPTDNDLIVAVGAEYVELKPLYLRLGWNSFGSNYRTANSEDSWAGFGFGVGFDVKEFHISYAYAPGAELGDSHRFTITGGI